jgi:hypothetical protein
MTTCARRPVKLPQGVRAADVVDVAVGEQDPADVRDAAPEVLERGSHAVRGRRGDPGVDDRRLGRVDEEAVQSESTPRRHQRVDSHLLCHRVHRRRNSAVSWKTR